MLRTLLATMVIVAFSLVPAGVQAGSHSAKSASALGEVHFIHHHLLVQPPGKRLGKGHIQESLFNRYRAMTKRGDLASVAFRDGTLLHFNQNTDATFRSPSLTYVKKGVIDQQVAPGTNHQVQTATAVASAVGTNFGIKTTLKKSLFFVLEGSLLVYNKYGSVYVQNGEATTVVKGHAPKTPYPYNVSKALKWVNKLPAIRPGPDPNLALTANGGHIVGASSQDGTAGAATGAIDGRLDNGWSSASGQVTNQSLKVGFQTNEPYLISAVAFSTQGFAQYPAAAGVQHFQILVSTTGIQDADFQPIFSGVARSMSGLQRFDLPNPTDARFVELLAQDNFGDTQHLIVTEFEVVGQPDPQGKEKVVTPCTFVEPCVQDLMSMLDNARKQKGLLPFQVSDTLSFGSGSCPGALGHSIDMALTQSVWHVNSKYPQASYPHDVCLPFSHGNENIGTADSGNEMKDIQTIFNSQISEPHGGTTCDHVVNHACNILDPKIKHIGVGLYFDGSVTWLTVIFINK